MTDRAQMLSHWSLLWFALPLAAFIVSVGYGVSPKIIGVTAVLSAIAALVVSPVVRSDMSEVDDD